MLQIRVESVNAYKYGIKGLSLNLCWNRQLKGLPSYPVQGQAEMNEALRVPRAG